MTVRIAAASHRGAVRELNEDAVGAAGWRWHGARTPVELQIDGDEPVVAVVADGVGGHPGGEVASTLAVEQLLAAAPAILGADDLSGALVAAHRHLIEEQAPRALPGMAATVAVVVVTEGAVLVGNVGDSRVYELHAGQLLQLSIDDRPAGGDGATVTQVLGGYAGAPSPHVMRLRREPRLHFLLCTDGLLAAVDEERIAAVVERDAPDWGRTANALVGEALQGGAPDNVSVAIVAVDP